MNLRFFSALLDFLKISKLDQNYNYGFSVLNLGKNATICPPTTYNEGEKLVSFLHDSPQMREKQVSQWEENLDDVLIRLGRSTFFCNFLKL